MSLLEQAGLTSAADTTETAVLEGTDTQSLATADGAGDVVTYDDPELAELAALLAPKPKTEGDAPVETTEPAQAEEEEEDPGEVKHEPGTRRMRIPRDDVWEMSLTITRELAKTGVKISPSEAETRAKAALGIVDAPKTEPTTAQPDRPAIDGLPEGIHDLASLEARIEVLQAEADAALDRAVDEFDDEAKAEAKAKAAEIRALTKLAPKLEAAKAADEKAYWAEFDRHEAEARSIYPELADETHPANSRAKEILDGWSATGDPRLARADLAKVVANLVAAELGLTPARRERAATTERPVTTSPSPVAKPPTGRGSSTTTAPAAKTSASALLEQLAAAGL
jgi:hypothetical protein